MGRSAIVLKRPNALRGRHLRTFVPSNAFTPIERQGVASNTEMASPNLWRPVFR